MKRLIPLFLGGMLFALLAISQEPVRNMDSALAVPGQVPVAGVNGATWGNQFPVNFNFTNSTIASGPNRTRIGAGFTMWSNNPSAYVVLTNGSIEVSRYLQIGGGASGVRITNYDASTIAFESDDEGQLVKISPLGFHGGGSELVNLNASTLASGTVPASRLAGVNAALNLASATNYGGIKVYRALLTQSGTAAPSATVLENTLGGTVVWARSVAGVYTATLTGAFTSNKTFASISLSPWSGSGSLSAAYVVRTSANVLTLTTVLCDPAAPSAEADDNRMIDTAFQILVYP